jgi:ABC-type transporter Mla subunit MlaD
MAAEKDYTRLGLFLLLGTIVALGTVLFFVQRGRERDVLELVTYTDQNVTGLGVKSAVRFKGVTVGEVDRVRVDSRQRVVEIGFVLFVDTMTALGADVERVRRVTTDSYLLLDTPAVPPAPMDLGFEPDRPHVPSMPSAMGRVVDQLPELIDRGEALLERTEQIMARLPESLDRADRFFDSGERVIRNSEIPALSRDVREWLQTTSRQVEELDEHLVGLVGERGTLTSLLEDVERTDLPETAEALRDTLDRAGLAAEALRHDLPAIRSALEELRALTRLLEEQPEDLVYGRRGQEESR